MNRFTCHTALITGASSGIGAAFARQLAKPGCTLVLVARRLERLQSFAVELEALGARVEPLIADLASEAGIQAVEQKIASLPQLDLLVNNAGFGITVPFAGAALQPQVDMLRVHSEAPLRFTHAALPGMLARRQGAVINVSSISGYMHNSNAVMYCATKAFLNTFSRALHASLRGTGVRIQALCPGFTRTEFHEPRENMDMDIRRIPAFMWLDSRRVAAASLRALDRDRAVVVPGAIYKLAVLFTRLGFI